MTAVAFLVLAGFGAVARWAAVSRFGGPAIMAVNVMGAFALGLLSASGSVPTAVGAGGLGALTTVSGLANHVSQLARSKNSAAAGYVVLTVVLGVGAAWGGLQIG